ncbi:MAG: hypothetical protein Q7S29_03090 [Candidatus Peribacter sp.]|nr:hypothetical protein [Candidatus Peribacter sp.]
METATRTSPADTFMEQLHGDPKMVEALSRQGIVIQSAMGKDVTADFWQGSEEEVLASLERMSAQSGADVHFTLRARG